MKKKISLVLLSVFVCFSFGATPNEWTSKVDLILLSKRNTSKNLNFLIVLKEQAELSSPNVKLSKLEKGQKVFSELKTTAKKSQSSLIKYLSQNKLSFKPYFIINAIQVKAPFYVVENMAKRAEVASIQNNPWVKMESPVEEIYTDYRGPFEVEWGIRKISADLVWEMGYQGQGVIIGGQDTGYDWEHPALKNKYRGWDGNTATHDFNWHDAIHEINPLHNDSILLATNNRCGLNSLFPCDDGSHGTHTMGTMVGGDGDNLIGVAPKAKWIACRNMERGYGSPSTYIECFEWFLAPTDLQGNNPDPSKSPHVINNSWSCPEKEGCTTSNFETMRMVIENVKKAGIVVVVSAGNDGNRGCSSISKPPSMFEESFSVGATRENDTIASFSSRGPVLLDNGKLLKPNVVAPGVSVRSSIPNGGYASFSGTSMSGPHTVGLVALIISANPDLAGQVETIENIIELSAIPMTAENDCGELAMNAIPNHSYGFGRIDALKAVNKALLLSPTTAHGNNFQNVQVYPNPFIDETTFEIRNLAGQVSLEIYSISGQLLSEIPLLLTNYELKTINLSFLSKGLYIFKIKNNEATVKGKFLKL